AGYRGIGQVGFVTALGSNYIALARAGGLGLLATVALLLPTERRLLMRLGLWTMVTLQLWATLIAGARGPVLALILSLALFFALSARGFPFIRIERYALRLGVLMLCVLAIFGVVGQEMFSTLTFRFQVLVTEVGVSALTRFALYREALKLWARSPIWGNGVGQFSVAVTGEDVRLYPHNIILELGAELGLIGVLIFAMMIGMAFAKSLVTLGAQRGSAKAATRYLLVVCCFALLNAMVSGDINDNRMLFTSIALLACVHRFQRGEPEIPLINNIRRSQTKGLAEGAGGR
ncbi:MAG: O-antigen ligase family protein, partial [Thermofilaceae archaeon]